MPDDILQVQVQRENSKDQHALITAKKLARKVTRAQAGIHLNA